MYYCIVSNLRDEKSIIILIKMKSSVHTTYKLIQY